MESSEERAGGEEEEEEERLMELLDSDPFLYLGSDHHHHLGVVCGGDDGRSCSSSSTTKDAITTNKRQKRGASASRDTIQVRKDKLGDKIAALQQIVSPFGKSDTASVLLEALGYIRFLHEQVQVLSSPYLLQRLPTTATLHQDEEEESRGGGGGELRRRGLCLVPISCTEQVANGGRQNGADLWSSPPSTGSSSSSSLYFSRH